MTLANLILSYSLSPSLFPPVLSILCLMGQHAEDVLPRIDNVLALNCVNFFIAFLNMSDCPDLQVWLGIMCLDQQQKTKKCVSLTGSQLLPSHQ